MSIVITNIILSKNVVKTEEKFKIQVNVKESTKEPSQYRVSFVLGKPKGNLRNV